MEGRGLWLRTGPTPSTAPLRTTSFTALWLGTGLIPSTAPFRTTSFTALSKKGPARLGVCPLFAPCSACARPMFAHARPILRPLARPVPALHSLALARTRSLPFTVTIPPRAEQHPENSSAQHQLLHFLSHRKCLLLSSSQLISKANN